MSLTAEHRPVLSTVANTTRRTDGNDRNDALTVRTPLPPCGRVSPADAVEARQRLATPRMRTGARPASRQHRARPGRPIRVIELLPSLDHTPRNVRFCRCERARLSCRALWRTFSTLLLEPVLQNERLGRRPGKLDTLQHPCHGRQVP